MNDSKWYVLKVVSGQEEKVKTYIEREREQRGLGSQIGQILMPSEKVYEIKGGKRQIKERQFFSGYLLLCADLTDNKAIDLIRETPNALGFLSARGWGLSKEPVPLRQAEINRILGKVDEAEDNEVHLDKPFSVGEMIKVIDGPFSGFSGSIQEIFEERKKLSVTVKIFERNTPVELGFGQVEKIS